MAQEPPPPSAGHDPNLDSDWDIAARFIISLTVNLTTTIAFGYVVYGAVTSEEFRADVINVLPVFAIMAWANKRVLTRLFPTDEKEKEE
jgi:hypothetical protein